MQTLSHAGVLGRPPTRRSPCRLRAPCRCALAPDGGDSDSSPALLGARMLAVAATASLCLLSAPGMASSSFQTPSVTHAPAVEANADAGDAPPNITLGGWVRASELEALVKQGRVQSLLLSPDGTQAGALLDTGTVVVAALVQAATQDLLNECVLHGVDVITASSAAEFELSVPQSMPASFKVARFLTTAAVPGLFLLGGLALLVRALRAGNDLGASGPFQALRLRAAGLEAARSDVRFSDVAGVEGAKQELREVVDFLKSPDKYTALGAKIPKGVLLTGPPGTGKTLLARAVAGEANVPFFAVAASEFVEMFVGVGASRVRDLFEKAKAKAPAIVFIDEIDAVGRQRGAGLGGGSDEREQTINQLLAEMDGFQGNTGIMVLAATNREDVLDSALLRPGRFDRRISVELPDLPGREAILKVHARKLTLAADADLRKLARRTPGFSGADLSNVLNEAAILAARRDKRCVGAEELNDALDAVALGPAKQNALVTPERRRLVAVHEAGHALVGALMPDYDSVQSISIVPRAGGTGGVTSFLPSEERLAAGFYSRNYLLAQLSTALGGRAAEAVVFGSDAVTTGAASDFRAVTRTARALVETAGLSRRFRHAALRRGAGPAFLGRDVAEADTCAVQTAGEADEEVRCVVEEAYGRAMRLLRANRGALDALVTRLLERESVDAMELEQLLRRHGSQVCGQLKLTADEEDEDGGDGKQSSRAVHAAQRKAT